MKYRKNQIWVNRLFHVLSNTRIHHCEWKIQSSIPTISFHISECFFARISHYIHQALLEIGWVDHISCFATYHSLSVSSVVCRYHRNSTGHRLDCYHPEVFIGTDAYTRNRSVDNIWEMIVIWELVKYYIQISLTEIYKFILLTIVLTIDYDEIFLWNLLKSPNNYIDSFGVSQSRKWKVIFFILKSNSLYCEYLRYFIFIEYLEFLCINTRIDHDCVWSSIPLWHMLLIGLRIHEYSIYFAEFLQVQPPQEHWEYEEKWTSQEWYLREILISLIEEMTWDRVGVVVCFCSFFGFPDACDSLVREEDSIVIFGNIARLEKSPFHFQKSEHSFLESWIYLEYISLESHRSSIIAIRTPYGGCDIGTECFRDLDIHAFCSASHQECIMK